VLTALNAHLRSQSFLCSLLACSLAVRPANRAPNRMASTSVVAPVPVQVSETMVGNALYKTMENALFPEHLTHSIAKRVHKDYQEGVCFQVNQLYSPFERLFREEGVPGEAMMEVLRREFPEMEVCVDEYYEWITVVLKMNATNFVMYHLYKEYGAHDNMVAEGRYVNGVMVFDRFQYKEMWRETVRYTSAKAYTSQERGVNWIPFQFLNNVMGGSHDPKDVKVVDAPAGTKWFNAEPILQWFDDCEDLIWMPIAEEAHHQQYMMEIYAENAAEGQNQYLPEILADQAEEDGGDEVDDHYDE
jgi:hypothetical protein